MSTKKGISKAIQALRVGGCHNGQLDVDGALGILLEDWYAAFSDITDDELRHAARTWLDRARDAKGFRAWPSSGDLREALKANRVRVNVTTEAAGCPDCDYTGWRSLLRIDGKGHRTEAAAPCACPKGHRISHPPPLPSNYQGQRFEPPEPYDAVAASWRKVSHEVLVTDRTMTRFSLAISNPEAWARAQAQGLPRGGPFALALRAIESGQGAPDTKRQAAGDNSAEPWREEGPW